MRHESRPFPESQPFHPINEKEAQDKRCNIWNMVSSYFCPMTYLTYFFISIDLAAWHMKRHPVRSSDNTEMQAWTCKVKTAVESKTSFKLKGEEAIQRRHACQPCLESHPFHVKNNVQMKRWKAGKIVSSKLTTSKLKLKNLGRNVSKGILFSTPADTQVQESNGQKERQQLRKN